MEIIFDSNLKELENSLGGESASVANVFYSMYKYSYICESVKHNSMWIFNNHKWEKEDESISIIKKLNQELSLMYNKYANILTKKAEEIQDDKNERER
jgi:DNA-binding transcriptional regulator/RsmH inhibitor MraZ